MPCYHLRVDYKSLDDREANMKFVERLKSVNTLIVHEYGEVTGKPHIHAQFWSDTIHSTLRQQWKKQFPQYDGRLNEYALIEVPEHKISDGEKYLCKGPDEFTPPDILLQTGKYTMEKTIDLHIEWHEIARRKKTQSETPLASGDIRHYGETIITHRVEKVVKPKKNFYNDVFDYLHRQYPDRQWVLRDSPIMLHAILKLHGKLFRPYGPQQLENEMNVIMNSLCFDEHYTDMYEQVKIRGNIPFL